VRDLDPGDLNEHGTPRDPQVVADLAASFQKEAVDQLVDGLASVVAQRSAEQVAVVGGVAANSVLRDAVKQRFDGLRVVVPSMALCTDNAGMIAAAGWHRLRTHGPDARGLDVDPGLDLYA